LLAIQILKKNRFFLQKNDHEPRSGENSNSDSNQIIAQDEDDDIQIVEPEQTHEDEEEQEMERIEHVDEDESSPSFTLDTRESRSEERESHNYEGSRGMNSLLEGSDDAMAESSSDPPAAEENNSGFDYLKAVSNLEMEISQQSNSNSPATDFLCTVMNDTNSKSSGISNRSVSEESPAPQPQRGVQEEVSNHSTNSGSNHN